MELTERENTAQRDLSLGIRFACEMTCRSDHCSNQISPLIFSSVYSPVSQDLMDLDDLVHFNPFLTHRLKPQRRPPFLELRFCSSLSNQQDGFQNSKRTLVVIETRVPSCGSHPSSRRHAARTRPGVSSSSASGVVGVVVATATTPANSSSATPATSISAPSSRPPTPSQRLVVSR
jgi:hypothetical protein